MPRMLVAFAHVHATSPQPPVGERLEIGYELRAGLILVRKSPGCGIDGENRHGALVGERAPVAASRVDLAVVHVEILNLARIEARPRTGVVPSCRVRVADEFRRHLDRKCHDRMRLQRGERLELWNGLAVRKTTGHPAKVPFARARSEHIRRRRRRDSVGRANDVYDVSRGKGICAGRERRGRCRHEEAVANCARPIHRGFRLYHVPDNHAVGPSGCGTVHGAVEYTKRHIRIILVDAELAYHASCAIAIDRAVCRRVFDVQRAVLVKSVDLADDTARIPMAAGSSASVTSNIDEAAIHRTPDFDLSPEALAHMCNDSARDSVFVQSRVGSRREIDVRQVATVVDQHHSADCRAFHAADDSANVHADGAYREGPGILAAHDAAGRRGVQLDKSDDPAETVRRVVVRDAYHDLGGVGAVNNPGPFSSGVSRRHLDRSCNAAEIRAFL